MEGGLRQRAAEGESADAGLVQRTIAERFFASRLLYRAQGIATYRGRDLHDDGPVVIKTTTAEHLGPSARVRLDYEIAVVNQQRVSGVARPVRLGVDGDLVYCVRPYLPGTTLEERIRARPLTARETVPLGIAVLSALAHLHAHGVVHRGIKPSNVILQGDLPERAQLVDFGIARYPRIRDVLTLPSLLAAQHLSPEQSGLIDAVLDGRTDLYSVGVMLYESVAGRPPFAGNSVGEVLRQHMTVHPPPLASLARDVPRGLDRIIGRLLRKDPRDRYQTAAGALSDLEELEAALARGVRDPEIVVGNRDLRLALSEPAFIGRDRELDAVDRALGHIGRGDGAMVLVEGESGQGKTWLLSELSRRSIASGGRVLRGHGLDSVAQRPYHVLDQMVRELVSMVHIEPEWGRSIAERLGAYSGPACASLPELGSILPEDRVASLGPELHGEVRTTAALTALIDAMGTADRPVVLVVDDAQWADESTMRLVTRWQEQPPLAGGRHVGVILAFRPEEIAADHPLRAIHPTHHLRLAEFGAEEVRQQVASMAGQLPEEVIQEVLRHAGGNPFLVSATLQGMVEVGALRGSAAGWQVNPQGLAKLHAAEHAVHILTLRVSRMEETPRRLLSVAALLGRTFDPVLAGALAGISPREAMRIADEHRGALLWADGSGTSFTFVHDKLRDALLESISRDERPDLHRRAAEHIQASDPDRVYDLAYHFDAAGDAGKALPFALSAAELARERSALDLAERYYRIAARGAQGAEPHTRFLLHKGLGEVIALRNRYGEAVGHYRRALDLAGTDLARAEVEQRWSQLEMKRGDMHAACEHAEGALRLIGHRVPRTRPLLVASSAWEAAVQVLHTHAPRLFVRPRKLGDDDDKNLLAIDLFHGLNGPYFFSRGVLWAGWAHLRLINLAERYPGTRALGRAYAAHAVSLNWFPRLFPRGLRISKAGADLCEQVGDPWGQAQGLTFHAMMLYYEGRFREAVDVGRRAAHLFDRTGDRWEANTGLDFAVDALVRMGDLRGAVHQAQEIWTRGVEINDAHAMAWSLDAWSRATDGRVPRELIETARSRSRDLQTATAVAQADGVRLIGEERYADAVAVLEEARTRNMKEAGSFYELNAPVLTYLATALRKQAEQVSPWAPGQRAQLLDRADARAKQALSVARKFRLNLPHALRESAFVAAMRDAPASARELIDESIAVADELGERYERAQSRVARAQLGRVLGWPLDDDPEAAREELEAIRGSVRALEAPSADRTPTDRAPLSLVDRFATILRSGRAIATALDPEAIYTQARRAALLLLRGERCAVLERTGDTESPEFVPVHGNVGMVPSQEVIRRAFEQDRAVALSAPEALEDVASRRSGARSVLCVPIRVRKNPYACMYLTHGDVSDLFGDDEQRIGDFLGTLTGAALENAEGFSRLESFSRELEARVEERTGQLARANQELSDSLRRVQEAQEQLVQAGKMAALGTLVSGLSHELNNPLSVVLGHVQLLLQQTPDDSPARRPLAAIERQALRCSRLAKALLNFSRAKPAARLRTSPVSLCATVLDIVAGEARDKEVEVRQDLPDEPLPGIVVSSQEVESALLNIVSNALDATPPGGRVILDVRAETRDEVPGVVFSVADTGKGIPSQDLPRIFDPFFTTKPVGRGTGLGLSLAHQAVTSHGGAIDADSTAGRGTTISIWLPVDSGEEAAGDSDAGPWRHS